MALEYSYLFTEFWLQIIIFVFIKLKENHRLYFKTRKSAGEIAQPLKTKAPATKSSKPVLPASLSSTQEVEADKGCLVYITGQLGLQNIQKKIRRNLWGAGEMA